MAPATKRVPPLAGCLALTGVVRHRHVRMALLTQLLTQLPTRCLPGCHPIGLHRTTILAVDGLRLQVSHLEAVDGTPVLDVKPVIGPVSGR